METNISSLIRSSFLNESDNKNNSAFQEAININQNEVIEFKIVLIGNSSVGKTAIFNRFIKGEFFSNYHATIVVEFSTKYLKVGKDLYVKLKIWDTMGSEKYQALTKQYYKGAQAVIVIFDLTDQKSFDDIKKRWLKNINDYAEKDIMILVVGNKLDLIEQRKVTESQAMNFCKEHGFKYIEASAKEGTNILRIFEELSFDLVNNYDKKKNEEKETQFLTNNSGESKQISTKKRVGCC